METTTQQPNPSTEVPVAETGAEQAAQAPTTQTPVSFNDLPDDEFEKELSRRLGRKAKLEDLKTPAPRPTKEELEEQAAKEERDALSWAFGTGKVKKEDYEKSIVEKSKTAREIALAKYTAELKEVDNKLTDSDCEEMFKDEYYEGDEESAPRRQRALKKMEREAKEYLAKYKELDGVVDEYRSYSKDQSNQKSYSKAVKSTIDTLPKEIVIELPDFDENGNEIQTPVSVEIAKEIFDELRKNFNSQSMYEGLGFNKAEVSEEVLKEHMQYHLDALAYKKAAQQLAVKYATYMDTKLKARLSGVPNTPPVPVGAMDTKQPTQQAKSDYAEYLAEQKRALNIK